MIDRVAKARRIRDALLKSQYAAVPFADAVRAVLVWVPVGDKIADSIDKLLGNAALRDELSRLQDALDRTNDRIHALSDDAERLQAITATIANNTSLRNEFARTLELTRAAIANEPEFSLLTTNWSSQELIDSIIATDSARFQSSHFSSSLIENSTVEALRTELKADGHSKNVIRNSEFRGPKGSVGFVGHIEQVGDQVIEGATISLSENSVLTLGSAAADVPYASEPYSCRAYDIRRRSHKYGYVVQVYPLAGQWSPFMFGVPIAEADGTSPAALPGRPGEFKLNTPTKIIYQGAGEAEGRQWWIQAHEGACSRRQPFFLLFRQMPFYLLFGALGYQTVHIVEWRDRYFPEPAG